MAAPRRAAVRCAAARRHALPARRESREMWEN